ncbi:MAG: DUF3093 domain-containing protein [Mycobacterium sp.]|nr:DUF3093 domain-containing protein [Mycobacterium sp.]MBV9351784.1 DUF3093 domain-containing protein [Mycobacterium sp.]
MTARTDTESAPLFYEPGASWYWLLSGPLSAGTMLMIEKTSGYGWQVLVPMVFLVLVTGFVGLQVKAARTHTSVELTEQTLRQGTETLPVAEIVKVYPEPERSHATEPQLQPWQSARTLGELVGVPRGRVGIGLRLAGGRTAQAWARRHHHLRAALTPLVEERVGPAEPEIPDEGEDGARW